MTCSSTVLKYSLAVLAQTTAAYILIYCNALSTTFTAVRCFQLRKTVLRLDATSYQIPRIRAQIELSSTFVYDYKMSTSGSSARNSHLSQGGRTTMTDHACESNNITVQNRIIGKILPVNKFTTLKFLSLLPSMNGYFFLIIMFCSAIHVYTDRFTDIGIIVIRPLWLRCEFLAELPLVLIFWS